MLSWWRQVGQLKGRLSRRIFLLSLTRDAALKIVSMQEAAGASTIFVDVLWAMVVLVGCSMSLGGCMVAYRHFKAGGGGAPMYLPVQAAVSAYRYLCCREEFLLVFVHVIPLGCRSDLRL